MILWLIHIEDCVTGNCHPVTRNHEWQKFGACFTNTLPNEEKCKSPASFRNLHLFSRQQYKKGRMFGEEPPFFALISCCQLVLCLTLGVKKKQQKLKTKPTKLAVFCGICIFYLFFLLCTRIASFHVLLGTHTCSPFPHFRWNYQGKVISVQQTKFLL